MEQLAESVVKLEMEINPRKQAELELSRMNEELSAAYEELMGTDQALQDGLREINKSHLALEQARNKLSLFEYPYVPGHQERCLYPLRIS
jgi:hypothetical protein